MSISNYKNRPVGFFANQQGPREKSFFSFDLEEWLKKTLIQFIVCTVLFFMLLTLKYIDTTTTNRMVEEISYVTNKPFHLSAGVATIKEWGLIVKSKGEAAIETLQLVDTMGVAFIQPMEGELAAGFQEINPINGQILKGILFEGNQGEAVLAGEEGVVVEVNSNQALGHYMVIKHRGELISVYKYLQKPLVEINSKVTKGQTIAESSDTLLFEIWERKEPKDPLGYMNLGEVQL